MVFFKGEIMKKGMVFLLLCLSVTGAAAQTAPLREGIRESVDAFSREIRDRYPDLTVKQGAVILEFREESPRARSKQMGTLVRVYLEEALSNSLYLYIVDRKNLSTIQEEYMLALSGLVDETTAPEVGYLSGARILLSGSVAEEAGDFLISIGMTDITTGELMKSVSFPVPDTEMVAEAENLQYEYVARNGIGLSVSTMNFLLADENFNDFPPMFTGIQAKYRISRSFMISAGIQIPVSTGESYRWDPSQDSSQYDVYWSDFQPDLPAPLDETIGQITSNFSGGFLFHLDGQYTLNFSPRFNVGIRVGFVTAPALKTEYRLSSNSGLYVSTTAYDSTDGSTSEVITRDYQPITLVFNPLFGGRIEICPEYFITPRLAVNAVLGYMITNRPGVRLAFASSGDWGFYDQALESNYNQQAEDSYFGLDPRRMPDGSLWTMNLTGLYAGISGSFFF